MYAPISPTRTDPVNQAQSVPNIVIAKQSSVVNSQTLNYLSSDHPPVLFSVGIQLNEREPRKYRLYKNTNWAAFKNDIDRNLQIQRHLHTKQDVDKTINYLTQTINDAIDIIPTL